MTSGGNRKPANAFEASGPDARRSFTAPRSPTRARLANSTHQFTPPPTIPQMASEARAYLEAEVRERARHATAESVRMTCSFARAERLIGREYHGRFLIELLQNAADAWSNDDRSRAGERCRVAVLV